MDQGMQYRIQKPPKTEKNEGTKGKKECTDSTTGLQGGRESMVMKETKEHREQRREGVNLREVGEDRKKPTRQMTELTGLTQEMRTERKRIRTDEEITLFR